MACGPTANQIPANAKPSRHCRFNPANRWLRDDPARAVTLGNGPTRVLLAFAAIDVRRGPDPASNLVRRIAD